MSDELQNALYDVTSHSWLMLLLASVVAILSVKLLMILFERWRLRGDDDNHHATESTLALPPESTTIGVVTYSYLNLYRSYIACSTCAPFLFKIIINLIWKKKNNETILNYINSNDLFNKSKFFGANEKTKKENKTQKWIDQNKRQLEQKDLSNLDVTFLNQLLSIVWYEKLSRIGSSEYEKQLQDEKSIESLILKVKNKRNEFAHDYTVGLKAKFIIELTKSTHDCMKKACQLLSITDYEKKIADIDQKFDKLIEDTITDYSSRVYFISDQLMLICYEILQKDNRIFWISLPGFDNIVSGEVFVNINLFSLDNQKNKVTFSCIDIFQQMTKRIAVISGDPGAGKTVLLRTIFCDILNGYNKFKGLKEIRMIVFISCRTNDYVDLGEYLKAKFKTQLEKFTNDEVLDAIRLVENLLFIIDGYDEVNDYSRKLVDSVIELCKEKSEAKCIISGRKKAASELSGIILRDLSIEHNHFMIEGINDIETRLRFLKSYGSKLLDYEKKNLLCRFESLEETAQNEFSSPVLLALFYSLVLKRSADFDIKKAIDVYEVLYQYFEDEIRAKLELESIPDSQDIARKIMRTICNHSVKMCNKQSYYFVSSDFLILMTDCKKLCSGIKSINRILSGVLSPEISLIHSAKKTFHFHHKTIQEYLVARKIFDSVVEKTSTDEYSLTEYMKVLQLNDEINNEKELDRVLAREAFLDLIRTDSTGFEMYLRVHHILILKLLNVGNLNILASVLTTVMNDIVQPDSEYCLQVISEAECNISVIEIFWLRFDDYSYFSVNEPHHLKALGKVLVYAKSTTKHITLGEIGTAFLYKTLYLSFSDSYNKFETLGDEIFADLDEAKCYIIFFKGCLDSVESLSVLKRKIGNRSPSDDYTIRERERPSVFLSVPSFADHKLKILDCVKAKFNFTVPYSEYCPGDELYPLPNDNEGKPPTLRLLDVPAGSQENVFKIINSLIPAGEFKMLQQIFLMRCELTFPEVDELLMKLYEAGIRTNSRTTKAIKQCDGYLLQLKSENYKGNKKKGKRPLFYSGQ